MARPIENILIAGNGFAAWASAAMLARATAGKIALRVVAAGPTRVGGIDEVFGSSRPEIIATHAAMGIGEAEFMRATAATFKLGTDFRDWGAIGESFLHAFGDIGARLDSIAFHQLLSRVRLAGCATAGADEYSLAATAARAGRFAHPAEDKRSVSSTFSYAYHFDVAAATAFLRSLALRLGVRELAGHIVDIKLREDGFLGGVSLDSGESATAQLFVDCSGVESRLLGQGLGIPFESWTHWLPCDRVMHRRVLRTSAPPPASVAAAHSAGWELCLPLRDEDVRALYYSSAHCTDEHAANQLGGAPAGNETPPVAAAVTCGRRRTFWSGNCVAIGASAAVADPITSTSVQLIYNSIARLIALFPHEDCAPSVRGEYQRLTDNDYQRACDFAALMYCTSRRDDSPFWRDCSKLPPPPALDYRLRLFRHGGRLAACDQDLFEESDWIGVLLGQGVWPERPDPLALALDVPQLELRIDRMRQIMRKAAEAMPGHAQYLDRLGLAPRTAQS